MKKCAYFSYVPYFHNKFALQNPLLGSVAQWLARRTRGPAVAGSIPSTAHVVIALGKQSTYISSVHPSAKWVPGYKQLKCIDY